MPIGSIILHPATYFGIFHFDLKSQSSENRMLSTYQRISIHVFMYPFFCEYRVYAKMSGSQTMNTFWIHFCFLEKPKVILKPKPHLRHFRRIFRTVRRYRCVRRHQRFACLAWAALDADLSSLLTDANALATEARRACSSLLRPSHHLFVICIGHCLAGYTAAIPNIAKHFCTL